MRICTTGRKRGRTGLWLLVSMMLIVPVSAQKASPAEYWKSLSEPEKVAFVNGAYATLVKLKAHHQHEVKKQYVYDPNWVAPYYIERFYEIIDEHLSQNVGYNLDIITQHMDALYANYDNRNIPLIDMLRIVSVSQDGDQQKANLLLLQAQRKYRP
ncbi:MAG: hypothetical protein GXO92_02610 [FCB group bacterium]|nr:hypothetical protein [FCB group bacterium]